MKLLFKTLKISAIIVISLTVILFSASLFFQNKVAEILLPAINRKLTTPVSFSNVRLSFLRNFPQASLRLRDVVVMSSEGFEKGQFRTNSVDTLLSAGDVTLEFSIKDIIRGNYEISTINASNGHLFIFTDRAGNINYDIEVKGGTESSDNFVINLDRINVSGIDVSYDNRAIDLQIDLEVLKGKLKSRISGSNVDFKAQGEMKTEKFHFGDFSFPVAFDSEIDIDLVSSDSSTLINKGSFSFDGTAFDVTGFADYYKNYAFRLISDNIDILNIKKYLPQKYLANLADYEMSGILNLKASLSGETSRTATPVFNLDFILSDGIIGIKNTMLTLKSLSLDGFFTNSPMPGSDPNLLILDRIKGTFDGEEITGSLKLSSFDPLSGEIRMSGKLIAEDAVKFFRIPHIKNASGTIAVDAMLTGTIADIEKIKAEDLLNMKSDISMSFNAFEIQTDNGISLQKVNGKLDVSDTIRARDLKFTFRDQNFTVSGWSYRLTDWLAGKNVSVRTSAIVTADRFYPESFLKNGAQSEAKTKKTAIGFPSDQYLDLDLKVNRFGYRTYTAENISAKLSYKPGLLNILSLSLNTMSGAVSGNGFLVRNSNKSLVGKGSFDLTDIDINDAFKTFRNFGQDFIVADNLSGRLSGKISVLVPADSMLNPAVRSITAEGKYVVTNGELKNFEPIKALSSFIEVSELENISFEKLENDFFIRNNFLYIPQMDVRSSAADLTISGKHSFNDDYEYHAKILLSELLSRKIPKPKPNTTEFGAVKDDGLGRTSLLLKIEDKGDDVKVSYDVKAAGTQIRNSIKSEKQTLKTILNQEYGWFRGDSAVREQPKTGSAPRFKITWDESPSAKADTVPPSTKKDSPIKNIFKKK